MHEHLKGCYYTAFSKATMPSTSKQTKLDSFTCSIVCSQTHSRDRVAGAIIKDLRPINFVDGEGFQHLTSPLLNQATSATLQN